MAEVKGAILKNMITQETKLIESQPEEPFYAFLPQKITGERGKP